MVSNIVYGRANKLKVLYRADINVWKLAGFSLTSRGDESRVIETRMQRRTSGYRAPELIQLALYTKKVDIWAFGCVTYELVTKRRAFANDFATYAYGHSWGELPIVVDSERVGGMFERIIRVALDREPQNRPSAHDLSVIIQANIAGIDTSYAFRSTSDTNTTRTTHILHKC
jgi:serine/threonine protein kinase